MKKTEEVETYMETNNGKNLGDTANATLRGKFTVIQAHIKEQEKISNKPFNFEPKVTRK